MASPPQTRAQTKRLYVSNLERLAAEPASARRSALFVALEPHRNDILAALAAGHTPHAIARVLVESEDGDDPNVATWSRQAVQRAVARMRTDGRTSTAPSGARPAQREPQPRARVAAPVIAQPPATPAAPPAATSPAPSRPATGFSNASRRP